MLEAMHDFLAADPPPTQVDLGFERSIYWRDAETAFRRAADPAVATLMRVLQLDPTECERLGEDEIRDWYFAHVAGSPVPADLDEWIRDAGYTDPGEFHRDAFAEYLRRVPGPGGRP
jgi:hypothetical protein